MRAVKFLYCNQGSEISSVAVDTVARNLYCADYGSGTVGDISFNSQEQNTSCTGWVNSDGDRAGHKQQV